MSASTLLSRFRNAGGQASTVDPLAALKQRAQARCSDITSAARARIEPLQSKLADAQARCDASSLRVDRLGSVLVEQEGIEAKSRSALDSLEMRRAALADDFAASVAEGRTQETSQRQEMKRLQTEETGHRQTLAEAAQACSALRRQIELSRSALADEQARRDELETALAEEELQVLMMAWDAAVNDLAVAGADLVRAASRTGRTDVLRHLRDAMVPYYGAETALFGPAAKLGAPVAGWVGMPTLSLDNLRAGLAACGKSSTAGDATR